MLASDSLRWRCSDMCGETIMDGGGKAADVGANEENAADEDDDGNDAGKRTTGTEWRLLDS